METNRTAPAGARTQMTRMQFLALDPHWRTAIDAPRLWTRWLPGADKPLPEGIEVEILDRLHFCGAVRIPPSAFGVGVKIVSNKRGFCVGVARYDIYDGWQAFPTLAEACASVGVKPSDCDAWQRQQLIDDNYFEIIEKAQQIGNPIGLIHWIEAAIDTHGWDKDYCFSRAQFASDWDKDVANFFQ